MFNSLHVVPASGEPFGCLALPRAYVCVCVCLSVCLSVCLCVRASESTKQTQPNRLNEFNELGRRRSQSPLVVVVVVYWSLAHLVGVSPPADPVTTKSNGDFVATLTSY